jgi:steroid 5-alpha reductase family enzyme
MTFFQVYFQALLLIIGLMCVLWIISVIIKNVSIVDLFWGFGFVLTNAFYFISTDGFLPRKIILLILVSVWGFRLSGYLARRNLGKGEDYRYKQFRSQYGEKRYWWISFFQTFLLQGILMWLISAPLLGSQYFGQNKGPGILDYAGIVFWITGFIFEAGGDYQLARFKANLSNKGKVLSSGFWHYTRHPNYFGDSAVWWGYGLFCMAAGSFLPIFGSILMTALIIKVSGVALLEKNLVEKKQAYREYIENTSSFFPWFPKKQHPSEK